MKKIALINGTIVLPEEISDHTAIVIDQDKILDICEVDTLGEDTVIVDVEGKRLGFLPKLDGIYSQRGANFGRSFGRTLLQSRTVGCTGPE